LENETLGELASAEGAVDLIVSTVGEIGGMPALDNRHSLQCALDGDEPAISEEEEDDIVVVRSFFDEIDTDKNGIISVEQAKAAATRLVEKQTNNKALCNTLVEALDALNTYASAGQEIEWEEFRQVIRYLPRARGQRVQWLRSLRLDLEVALLLKQGDIFDGLSGLRGMTKEESGQHVLAVCKELTGRLQTLLMSKLETLRTQESGADSKVQSSGVRSPRALRPMSKEQFSKFSMDGSFERGFAKLQHFDDGSEKLIGRPNLKAEEGIWREHCESKNARNRQIFPNYNFEFYAEQEYEFVVCPNKGYGVYGHTPKDKDKWPAGNNWEGGRGREATDLKEVMQHNLVKVAGLKAAEVISLRLYTGPMCMLYNAVLSKLPKTVFESLQGNRYETTIFCIISAISKLSKTNNIPHDRRVFRGLGEKILLEKFWSLQEGGFRGGIELGFMSTSTNSKVAMQYSESGFAKQRCAVFEIAVGRVDIVADLSWLSQYPGEKEYLFAPLTSLEVVGEPRVEGQVIVFPMRANINLKYLTLEQLEERRKKLHLAMAWNLMDELSVAAKNILFECSKFSHDKVDFSLKISQSRVSSTPLMLYWLADEGRISSPPYHPWQSRQ
jgi:hypothetical protein